MNSSVVCIKLIFFNFSIKTKLTIHFLVMNIKRNERLNVTYRNIKKIKDK